jgi:hypothetical protein
MPVVFGWWAPIANSGLVPAKTNELNVANNLMGFPPSELHSAIQEHYSVLNEKYAINPKIKKSPELLVILKLFRIVWCFFG